jgi:hypothetical protein
VQAADDPPVTQAQPLPATAAAEVCCCQSRPLLIVNLFQLEQHKLAGIPELVSKVAVGVDPI